MLERVGNEIPGRRLLDKIVDGRTRCQQRDGIEKHRRTAIDHVVGLDESAVRRRDTANLGGDKFEDGFFGGNRLGQPLQQFRIHAISDENAELAAFKPFGTR
ncbi:Uncharacterised protein [Agrobacterium tumefaciens]|nr:Uncharacterised protein [Agrobacterium tumefaciens]